MRPELSMPSSAAMMERTRSAQWEERVDAVRELARCVEQKAVRDRLVDMLDDENLAVCEAAATQLVRHGGAAGLAGVVRKYAALDDQVGAYVGVAVSDAADYPLAPALKTLVLQAGDDAIRDGARDLAEYLGLDLT